jgi:hypothetical protein
MKTYVSALARSLGVSGEGGDQINFDERALGSVRRRVARAYINVAWRSGNLIILARAYD